MRNRRILLLVEDEILLAQSIERMCRRDGTVIHAASEGEALARIAEEGSIHVALIDVKLGDDRLAGLRVLEVLCTKRPEARRVVMTGWADWEVMRHAAARQALFLPKPFDSEAMQLLRELLSSAGSPQDEANNLVEANIARHRLVGQQARLFRLAAGGRTRDEIAAALGVTLNTARVHIQRVFRRTGFTSLRELRTKMRGTSK
jgi:DNA-binding NarL/FixJ family response regulator